MKVYVTYPAIENEQDQTTFEDEKIFRIEIPDQSIDIALDDVFRRMNVVDGSDIELPVKLKCRSMMVGDIVQINDNYFICDNVGWYKATRDFVNIWKKLSHFDRCMGVAYQLR